MNNFKLLLVILIFLLAKNIFGQSKVAITIDDVPKTRIFEENNFRAILLDKIDTLKIPVTIFVNEELVYTTDSISKNLELLHRWTKNKNVAIGNHTFRHSRYSKVGLDSFAIDIDKGEKLLKHLTSQYNKDLKYFRFPYNDLGKDSLQQTEIKALLSENNYIIAPFTIESSDWMFNYLYKYHLEKGNIKEADKIAKIYIDKTLEYFSFFDSVAVCQYDRHINQIYLCHDNSINADYIDILIKRLTEKGYSFVSLEDAMQDKVYEQANNYYKKWGISWIYRWMKDEKEIKNLMHQEPDIMESYKMYQELSSKSKN